MSTIDDANTYCTTLELSFSAAVPFFSGADTARY